MKKVCPNGRNATQALREIDELHGTQFAPLVDDLIDGDLRASFTEAEDAPQGDRPLGEVLDRCFSHGLTLADTGRLVGRHPLQLAGHLVHDPARAKQVLMAERLLREGVLTHQSIADRVNMPRQTVSRLAQRFGLVSVATERIAQGGGYVHSPETFERMRELREAGRSFGEIADELGVSRNTVKSHCRRKGWAPKVGAGA